MCRPLVFGFLGALVLSGCAIGGDSPGPVVQLPARSDSVQNIEVKRDSVWNASLRTFYLTVDGRDVAKLRAGRHVTFGLENGEYILGVRCPNERWQGLDMIEKWVLVEHEIDVIEPGERFYIHIAPSVADGCRIYQR